MLHVATYGDGIRLLPERGDVRDERGGPAFKFTRPSDGAFDGNERAGELLALAHSDLRAGEFGKEDDAKVDAANLIGVIIQQAEWRKTWEHGRLNLFTPLARECGKDAAVVSTDMSTNTEGGATVETSIAPPSKTIHPKELAFSRSGSVKRDRIWDRLLPLGIQLELTTWT